MVAPPLFSEIGADAAIVAAMAREAEHQGLAPGRLLAWGGYSAVFQAEPEDLGPCVLKVPWPPRYQVGDIPITMPPAAGPNRLRRDEPTGHVRLDRPANFDDAAMLLRESLAQQQGRKAGRPLARLLRSLSLARVPVGLYERLQGPSLEELVYRDPERARSLLAPLARALLELHRVFGPHGDLKPSHVFAEGEAVVLIDPVVSPGWLGSLGYALPIETPPEAPPELSAEAGRARDVAAWCSVAVRTWQRSFGWEESQLLRLAARSPPPIPPPAPNPFGTTPADLAGAVELATAGLPVPLGGAIRLAALHALELARGVRPLEPGWASGTLEELAIRAAAPGPMPSEYPTQPPRRPGEDS